MNRTSNAVVRRNVLKAVGAVTALSNIPVTSAKERPTMDGLVYDPVSHKVLGEARANLHSKSSKLNGTITLPDKKISFNRKHPSREKTVHTESGEMRSYSYIKDGKNIPYHYAKVNTSNQGSMSGIIRGGPNRKVAFSLFDSDKGNIERLLKVLEDTKNNTNKDNRGN